MTKNTVNRKMVILNENTRKTLEKSMKENGQKFSPLINMLIKKHLESNGVNL